MTYAVYASKTREEKFSSPGENCQRNVTDVAGSLVASSRLLPGRLQKRPDYTPFTVLTLVCCCRRRDCFSGGQGGPESRGLRGDVGGAGVCGRGAREQVRGGR